jgi:small subunit ribosomal protein S3e
MSINTGVLGVSVKIMKPYDPTGKNGCSVRPADVVTIAEPKEEEGLPVAPKTGTAENYEKTEQH